jgi:tetratricopeptide (TPR) repeat protein
MQWLRSLRSLAIIYGIALVVACWEYTQVQHGDPQPDPLRRDLDRVERLSDVYGKLYPRRRSPAYYQGFEAFHRRDYAKAREYFEQALAADDKDENLLYEYAETLVRLEESPEVVNRAVAAWRWNFPFSQFPDPRDEQPGLVDSPEYMKGVDALLHLDLETARRYFERDLAAGTRSEQLLYNYALTLLLMNEDPTKIERVIRQWKRDYPFSTQPDPRQAVEQLKRRSGVPPG